MCAINKLFIFIEGIMILNKSSIACALLACSFVIGSVQAKYEDTDGFYDKYQKCIEIESGVTWDELNEDEVPQVKQDAYDRVFESGPKWSTLCTQAPNDPIVQKIGELIAAVGFKVNSETCIKGSFDLETDIGDMGYDVAGDNGKVINDDWVEKKFNKRCTNVQPNEVFYKYSKHVIRNVQVGGTKRNPIMKDRKMLDDTLDVRFMANENKIVYSNSHPW